MTLNKALQSAGRGEGVSFSSAVAGTTSSSLIVLELEHPFWNAPFCLVEVNTRLATDNDTRVYEDPQEEILRFREVVKARQGTLVADDEPEELLDWDAHIETPPPPRQSGTIKVRFNYVGRSKPIPIDDTWT
ncbi:MAG TPA: hypothetical protein VJJ98_03520 [Sedimentisphaerales bacterium]|nr:hypothetical protein [Sedimentisphaerales bacterium]